MKGKNTRVHTEWRSARELQWYAGMKDVVLESELAEGQDFLVRITLTTEIEVIDTRAAPVPSAPRFPQLSGDITASASQEHLRSLEQLRQLFMREAFVNGEWSTIGEPEEPES